MRMQPALLHLLTIHARSGSAGINTGLRLAATLEVDVFKVEGVDMAGEVAGPVSIGWRED